MRKADREKWLNRLLAKTVRIGGCLFWLGARKGGPRNKEPYGHYRCVLIPGETIAHRVSYILHGRKISKKKKLMHSCDNTLCIDPEHLTPGTQLQNQQDMTAKGRGRFGARNGRYKDGKYATLRLRMS